MEDFALLEKDTVVISQAGTKFVFNEICKGNEFNTVLLYRLTDNRRFRLNPHELVQFEFKLCETTNSVDSESHRRFSKENLTMEDFQRLQPGTRVTDMYGNGYLFYEFDNRSHYGIVKLFHLGKQEHQSFTTHEVTEYQFKLGEYPRQTVAKPPLFPTEKVDDVTLGGLYKLKNPHTDCPLQIYRVIDIFY